MVVSGGRGTRLTGGNHNNGAEEYTPMGEGWAWGRGGGIPPMPVYRAAPRQTPIACRRTFSRAGGVIGETKTWAGPKSLKQRKTHIRAQDT